MPRTDSIDLLRGFIIMLMAIDHTSGMVARTHFTEVWGFPFAGYETLGWWFTRFVSHLCAPGFFFLMGMSIYLFAQKRLKQSWRDSQIRQYFFKRGGLILLFMFFLEFPAWALSGFFSQMPKTENMMPLPGYFEGGFFLPTTVLYGLGMCMIIGAFLWKLNKKFLLSISIVSFLLSAWQINRLDPNDVLNPIQVLLTTPGLSQGAMSLYPVIPWIGVCTFGMLWAKLLETKKDKIYPISLFTGMAFLLIFLVLRFFQIGNFQQNPFDDWISFFTLIKYPPSITFILSACGINLILFYIFSKFTTTPLLKPVKLFGQTAMFFYILHLYLYALIGAAFPLGCSIYVLYLVWALGLFLLYFPCFYFKDFKQKKPKGSIWKMI